MAGEFWGLSLQWIDGFYLVGSTLAIFMALVKGVSAYAARSRVIISRGSKWTSMEMASAPRSISGRFAQIIITSKGRVSLTGVAVEIEAFYRLGHLSLENGFWTKTNRRQRHILAVTRATAQHPVFSENYQVQSKIDLPKGQWLEVRVPFAELSPLAAKTEGNETITPTITPDPDAEIILSIACRPEGTRDAKALYYVRPHDQMGAHAFGRVRWWHIRRRWRRRWWLSNRFLIREARRISAPALKRLALEKKQASKR